MANVRETLHFLSWWKDRLWHFSLMNPAEGMFLDQRWIDLVPSLFEKFHIVLNPGYNVAYWNLHERKLSLLGIKIHVNGELLRFFHFSAFDPDNSEAISKYQGRPIATNYPALRYLAGLYRNSLLKNGYKEISAWPYTYNCFDNGVEITEQARRVYWELGDKAKKFGNPFKTGKENSFFTYYRKKEKSVTRITNFGKKIAKKFFKSTSAR